MTHRIWFSANLAALWSLVFLSISCHYRDRGISHLIAVNLPLPSVLLVFPATFPLLLNLRWALILRTKTMQSFMLVLASVRDSCSVSLFLLFPRFATLSSVFLSALKGISCLTFIYHLTNVVIIISLYYYLLNAFFHSCRTYRGN